MYEREGTLFDCLALYKDANGRPLLGNVRDNPRLRAALELVRQDVDRISTDLGVWNGNGDRPAPDRFQGLLVRNPQAYDRELIKRAQERAKAEPDLMDARARAFGYNQSSHREPPSRFDWTKQAPQVIGQTDDGKPIPALGTGDITLSL
jgi:hypothetical protein